MGPLAMFDIKPILAWRESSLEGVRFRGSLVLRESGLEGVRFRRASLHIQKLVEKHRCAFQQWANSSHKNEHLHYRLNKVVIVHHFSWLTYAFVYVNIAQYISYHIILQYIACITIKWCISYQYNTWTVCVWLVQVWLNIFL